MKRDWEKWKYEIPVKLDLKVKMSEDENIRYQRTKEFHEENCKYQLEENKINVGSLQKFTLSLNFLHFIILTRRSKILKYLMKQVEISDEYWMKEIEIICIDEEDSKNIVKEEDVWIFEANCLHLASKFHPKSLHVLLCNVKNKEELLKQSHRDGKISPLHVAPLRVDTHSTRSVNTNCYFK